MRRAAAGFATAALVAGLWAARRGGPGDGGEGPAPRLFLPEELSVGGGGLLRLVVLGEVYDVSSGAEFYGSGAPYHGFVGRDASRAFSTGAFEDEEGLHSLAGLTPEQQKAVWDWRQFYRDHEVYKFLGRLRGTYYDAGGRATDALRAVEEQVALAEQAAAARSKSEREIPRCNLEWDKDRGGRVWCEAGFPRKVQGTKASASRRPSTRCGCVPETLLAVNSGIGEVYPECSPTSRECKTG